MRAASYSYLGALAALKAASGCWLYEFIKIEPLFRPCLNEKARLSLGAENRM